MGIGEPSFRDESFRIIVLHFQDFRFLPINCMVKVHRMFAKCRKFRSQLACGSPMIGQSWLKATFGLTNINIVTVRTRDLVNNTTLIFCSVRIFRGGQNVANGFYRSHGNTDSCLVQNSSNSFWCTLHIRNRSELFELRVLSLRAFVFAREKSSSGRKSVKLQSRTYVS